MEKMLKYGRNERKYTIFGMSEMYDKMKECVAHAVGVICISTARVKFSTLQFPFVGSRART